MQKKYKVVVMSVLCCALNFNGPEAAHAALVESGVVSVWKPKILFGGGIEYFSSYVFGRTKESNRFSKLSGVQLESKKLVQSSLSGFDQQLRASLLIARSA